MDVSIIIVNFNTFDLTCQCIASLYQKITGSSFEVILVDNGSTETNPEKFLSEFPDIKLIVSRENVGFARGNNLGIRVAAGEYVVLLNSDAVLRNDAVTIVKEFLKVHPDVGAASGRLEYPDGRIQNNCQRFPSVKVKMFELLRLQKILKASYSGRFLMGSFFDYQSVAFPDWIWGTFFMFRKSLLEEFEEQKLPDQFFMYVEDMQWCMELRQRGYSIAFVPDAQIIHHMGKSGAHKSPMMEKNLAWFMKQYYSAPQRYLIKSIDRLLG